MAAERSAMLISNGLSAKPLSWSCARIRTASSSPTDSQKKHGKGKALSILSARLGRAVYVMLKRREPFDAEKFLTQT
jgi:hypothetical protein